MEMIQLQAEFLFELADKNDWIRRVPNILPKKRRYHEKWVWVDSKGRTFENGLDFDVAEKENTFPCKVYRLITVSGQ